MLHPVNTQSILADWPASENSLNLGRIFMIPPDYLLKSIAATLIGGTVVVW